MLKIIAFLSIFILNSVKAQSSLSVPSEEVIKRCGDKPGILSRFFTDAEKMRLICIDQIFEEYKRKRDEEVDELDKISKELNKEISKVAVHQTVSTLDCGNPNTRPEKLVEKCRELNIQRNLILKRIDHLMGWDQEFKSRVEASAIKPQSIEIVTPCPSEEELNKMKAVRYFHRKLYKTYERCRTLNPKI